MTQPKHSPLPWGYEYDRYTTKDGKNIPAFSIFDAEANRIFDTNEDTPADLQEANACLAVAAPSLLEELSYFLEFAELNGDGEDEMFARHMAAARIAIARATGRAA
jgi:hypothetical protein